MTYLAERDGIAACPDDPARVAPPDEWSAANKASRIADPAETIEDYERRTKAAITATLAGHAPGCLVLFAGRIQYFNKTDIAEILRDDVTDEEFATLLAGSYDVGAIIQAQKLVDEWITRLANETAAELAQREMQR